MRKSVNEEKIHPSFTKLSSEPSAGLFLPFFIPGLFWEILHDEAPTLSLRKGVYTFPRSQSSLIINIHDILKSFYILLSFYVLLLLLIS